VCALVFGSYFIRLQYKGYVDGGKIERMFDRVTYLCTLINVNVLKGSERRAGRCRLQHIGTYVTRI